MKKPCTGFSQDLPWPFSAAGPETRPQFCPVMSQSHSRHAAHGSVCPEAGPRIHLVALLPGIWDGPLSPQGSHSFPHLFTQHTRTEPLPCTGPVPCAEGRAVQQLTLSPAQLRTVPWEFLAQEGKRGWTGCSQLFLSEGFCAHLLRPGTERASFLHLPGVTEK